MSEWGDRERVITDALLAMDLEPLLHYQLDGPTVDRMRDAMGRVLDTTRAEVVAEIVELVHEKAEENARLSSGTYTATEILHAMADIIVNRFGAAGDASEANPSESKSVQAFGDGDAQGGPKANADHWTMTRGYGPKGDEPRRSPTPKTSAPGQPEAPR